MSETEKQRLQILDNVSYGTWDTEILAEDWDLGLLGEWDLDFALPLGDFSDQPLFGEPAEPPIKAKAAEDVEDDGYEIPHKVETQIKNGDVLDIGAHRVICGSCLSDELWNRLLDAGQKADLILTDPPYGVNYQGVARSRKKIANDNLPEEAFAQFLYDFYTKTAVRTKIGAPWYIFHSDSGGHLFRQQMLNAGITIKQCLIWEKSHFILSRQDYHWQHEPILYG